MRTDKYGRQVYTEDQLCNLIMCSPETDIDGVYTETPITIPADIELDRTPNLHHWVETDKTIEEFDLELQNGWFMPEHYKNLDIVQYLIDRCSGEAQLQRVAEELLLYMERNMFPLLRYMVYLVDTLRGGGVVWGVGRGSSVCSYVLYLIGVHRIDSLHYDLDIKDFLK